MFTLFHFLKKKAAGFVVQIAKAFEKSENKHFPRNVPDQYLLMNVSVAL